MNILSISIDRTLSDPASQAALRQPKYYEGHTARIIVLASGSRQEIVLAPGLVVERIGGRFKPWIFLKTLVRMCTLSWSEPFDVVTSQDASYTGFCALIFSRLQSIPLVVQLHGDYLDNPLWIKQKRSHGMINVISKWILRHADGVRCVSQRLRHQVMQEFGIPEERTISLPICTDLSIFSPQGERRDGGTYILFVGRLLEEKSPFLFCDAVIPLMQESVTLKVVLAGEGNLRQALEHRFVQAGLMDRAIFVGQQGATELAVWYRSSVCLVHTAAWEGWGMPMIEAMACGCPVVTTDSGCAGEAVKHEENGLVVAIDDVEGLRQATRRLLQEPEFCERLSHAAVTEAARWDFVLRAKDQVHFYERIIQNTTRAHHGRRGTGGS